MTLNNIGKIYNLQGRYADAMAYFQQCIKLNGELGSATNKNGVANNLDDLGILYQLQGRYEQSLEHYRKSLKIREELGDQSLIRSTQNNIGVVYKSQGLYEQALEWFEKSLKQAEEMDIKEGVATCLNNIGDIHRLQGRYEQALEPLLKSLRLRKEINERVGITRSLTNLGRLYQDQGRYAEMLEVSRHSATLAEEINAREELWNAHEHIGRALQALGRPAEAHSHFLAAISVLESLRHEVAGGEQQRQSFLENRLSPWRGMIALLVSQKEYAEALSFAERSKARALLDTFQSGRASFRQSLSPQERQSEEEQRLRLVSLNSQLTRELQGDKPDSSRVAELKSSIEKARL